jgi:hypothetical protein
VIDDPNWVSGVPTSFGTSVAKDEWRSSVRRWSEGAKQPGPADTGIWFAFVLPYGRRADVDNLCDPVWEVLIGKKHGSSQWFGGRRTNLLWMASTKAYGERSGCTITTGPSVPDAVRTRFARVLLDDTYDGPQPRTVVNDPAHEAFSDWAVARAQWIEPHADVSVWFRFGGRRNLGDIATGPIKAMLDGLARVLGEHRWRDVDDRVVCLVTEKMVPEVAANCVGVTVAV